MMKNLPLYSVATLAVAVLFIHIGTPLVAEFFYELYHLVKVDFVYDLYSVARYLSSQFMFWSDRWMVTLAVGIIGTLLVLRRWRKKNQLVEA